MPYYPKILYLKIATMIFIRGREDRGASRTLSIPEIGFTLGSVTAGFIYNYGALPLFRNSCSKCY